jgi:ABC-type multidrug transport system fused ATPase/permease subunit
MRLSDEGTIFAHSRALLGERKGAVLLLAVASLLAGFAESGILAVIAQVASTLVSGHWHVEVAVGPVTIKPSVGAMLAFAFGLAVLRLLMQSALSFIPARIAGNVQAQLRRELFAAFSGAAWAIQSKDREGHLQELMTSQIMQATQGAMGAAFLVSSFLTFTVLVVTALVLNLVAAIVVLATAGGLFVLLQPLTRLGTRRARSLSRVQMEYAGAIGEATRMAEETQVFGVIPAQREQVEGYIMRSREWLIRTQTLVRLVPAIYQSLIYMILVVGLAALYASGSTQAASLGAVVLLLIRAGTYGQQVQTAYQTVRQGLPFIERLREAEQRYIDSRPAEGTKSLHAVRTLSFDHVSFGYRDGAEVLSDIDFEVVAGESIGIIGPSGAGKSTTVQILLQLREPTSGRYLVNGELASEIRRKDWWRRVSYVPQEPNLIHASVAENIRYFRDIDHTAIERAARLAHIHDDIVSWETGYETIVGPRADAVSGGQQQRLCLARALAAHPDMLILDEPTSALDPRSEVLIRRTLSEIKDELTLFVVAHRPSMMEICDRVMVIVDGRLEAFGTRSNLAETSSYHRSIAEFAGPVAEGVR